MRKIDIKSISNNKGQINGVPANPRRITEESFEKLKKNIEKYPDFLNARPLIVVPDDKGRYICLAGNMRLRAMRKLGWEQAPCEIVSRETSEEKLRAYAILDNSSSGEWDWDMVANEWNAEEMIAWDIPAFKEYDISLKKERATEALSQGDYVPIYYEPKRTKVQKLSDCMYTYLYEKKLEAIDSSEVSRETKDVMKVLAYRFIRIDYEAIADYYSFIATDEEKKILQRLRLVLVDDGSVGGFVEDGLLGIMEKIDLDDVDNRRD